MSELKMTPSVNRITPTVHVSWFQNLPILATVVTVLKSAESIFVSAGKHGVSSSQSYTLRICEK